MEEIRFWKNVSIILFILLLAVGYLAYKGSYYKGKIDVFDQMGKNTSEIEYEPADTVDYGDEG